MPCCNSRLRGHADGLQKRPPGPHAGEGSCGAAAGAGTEHEGEGRCYRHGGATRGAGAPAGNKNAVTTGEHETIRPEDITAEERARVDAMSTDARTQTALHIRLSVIRLSRMMARIHELREEAGELTDTEKSTRRGKKAGGRVELDATRQRATLDLIMMIEESITRLQGVLTRLLKLRHEVTGGAEAQRENKELLAQAVRRATAQLGDLEPSSNAEDE